MRKGMRRGGGKGCSEGEEYEGDTVEEEERGEAVKEEPHETGHCNAERVSDKYDSGFCGGEERGAPSSARGSAGGGAQIDAWAGEGGSGRAFEGEQASGTPLSCAIWAHLGVFALSRGFGFPRDPCAGLFTSVWNPARFSPFRRVHEIYNLIFVFSVLWSGNK
ncbi:Protein of unknown function, partial [Gryllus bimaculatus]